MNKTMAPLAPKASSPVDLSTGSSQTSSSANKATNANPSIKYEELSSKQKAGLVSILQGNLSKAECKKYQDYFTIAGRLRAPFRPVFDEKDKNGKLLISQEVKTMHTATVARVVNDKGKSSIDGDASPKDGAHADDGNSVYYGAPTNDGTAVKDGASTKDNPSTKKRSSTRQKAAAKDQAAAKDKTPTENEAPTENEEPAEITGIEPTAANLNETLIEDEPPVEDISDEDVSVMELEPRVMQPQVMQPRAMEIDEDVVFDRMEPWYDPIGSSYSPPGNAPLRVDQPTTSAAGQTINPHAHPIREETSIDQILLNSFTQGQFDINLRSDHSFIRILRRLDDEFRTLHHNLMTATSTGNLDQQTAHEYLRTVLDMREHIWSTLGRTVSGRTASQRQSLMSEYEHSGPANST